MGLTGKAMIQFPKINGHYRSGNGFFSLPDVLCIQNPCFAPWCTEVFCQRCGLVPGSGTPWLILNRDSSLPREGYLLKVNHQQVEVTAATEEGIVWALTTLYLRMEAGRKIACCEILDAPRYPHRGQSLDCVRHFFPVEEVKKILEQMALVKMNVLHLHLTDDQGWRIESLRFPQLHNVNADYFTQAELREIVEFARVRGIDIIPEIDLPGHTTAILAACPELGCTGKQPELATSGGIYTTILCAGNEAVYTFLAELLTEICELFPSKRFHIGGDEAPRSQWHSCPVCKAAMERLEIEDYEALQGYFTSRVIDILKECGKTPICWNETLKGYPDPEDLEIQYWTMDDIAKMNAFAKRGGNYIYSYMCQLYLDYPYSMTSVKKLYKLQPQIWLRNCGNDPGMLGMESTIWAEHISEPKDLEEHLFPRMYIVAEKAWTGAHESYPRLLASLRALCALAAEQGVSAMRSAWWNPAGKARREEALDFFTKMNGGVLEDVPDNQAAVEPDLRVMFDYVTRFFRLSDLPALYKLYFQ